MHSIIEHHNQKRNELAWRIKEFRKGMRQAKTPQPKLNKMIKDFFINDKNYRKYFKPNASNLWSAAINNLHYSRSPIPTTPHYGEYYTCCGMDDYHDMKRQHARQCAIEYFQAWKELKGV